MLPVSHPIRQLGLRHRPNALPCELPRQSKVTDPIPHVIKKQNSGSRLDVWGGAPLAQIVKSQLYRQLPAPSVP